MKPFKTESNLRVYDADIVESIISQKDKEIHRLRMILENARNRVIYWERNLQTYEDPMICKDILASLNDDVSGFEQTDSDIKRKAEQS